MLYGDNAREDYVVLNYLHNQVLRVGRKEGEAFMWYVVLEHPEISEIADWLKQHTAGHQIQAGSVK